MARGNRLPRRGSDGPRVWRPGHPTGAGCHRDGDQPQRLGYWVVTRGAGDAQSGDTIQFASGLSGTIELNSELEFSGDLTIVGNDDVAIDGQHDTVIFLFRSGGVISLSGLTLENGLANDGSVNGPLGGAISTRSAR